MTSTLRSNFAQQKQHSIKFMDSAISVAKTYFRLYGETGKLKMSEEEYGKLYQETRPILAATPHLDPAWEFIYNNARELNEYLWKNEILKDEPDLILNIKFVISTQKSLEELFQVYGFDYIQVDRNTFCVHLSKTEETGWSDVNDMIEFAKDIVKPQHIGRITEFGAYKYSPFNN